MEKRKQIEKILFNDYGRIDQTTVDKLCDLFNVVGRRELLLNFAEYSENDKKSEHLDELVDNYLDSIKE